MSHRAGVHLIIASAIAGGALAACGKKGPPLPPLHLVPNAVSDVSARRLGDEMQIRFVLPTKNLNGPDPINLDRVEIYAATVAAGAVTPPIRDLLNSKYVVGTIRVKPPADDSKPAAAPAAPDDRPAPGESVTFVETLTDAALRPQFTTPLPAAAAAPAAPSAAAGEATTPPATGGPPTNPPTTPPTNPPAAPPATPPSGQPPPATSTAGAQPGATGGAAAGGAAQAAAPQAPAVAMRIYVIRGLARNGRPGQPSPRIQLPLVPLPPAPSGVSVAYREDALSISWLPAVVEAETAKPPTFSVYEAKAVTPLNASPVAAPPYERKGLEFGKEECFTVRSVTRSGTVSIESAPAPAACVTPVDTFAPAEPSGLSAVAVDGGINLIWNANTEADLAGYIVLRGEAPGDTLQPVTSAPIQSTTYRDTSVKTGVRYVYAVVAIDKATPPNASPQSRRVEETAR